VTIVTIQEYGASQSGLPKTKASGKWYFLGKSLGQPPMGQQVEIKEGSFAMGNKTFPTIEAWRRPAGGNASTQIDAPAPSAPPAGYVDEATMRFISNCVGSAIMAKTITEPGQILSWYQAAKSAHEGKPAPIPFDDSSALDDAQRQATSRW
jgi:hypothetical protein